MNRSLTALTILLACCGSVAAQAPRALPVDPSLRANPGEDLFQRGKNLHDQAVASTDQQSRIQLFQRGTEVLIAYLNEFGAHPNAEMAMWYLGDCHYQGGNIDEGKRWFSILINRYGKGRWVGAASYTLAADHFNRGEYAMAGPMFERSAGNLGKAEDRARSLYYAATCFRMTGQDRSATAAYQKVIADPAGVLLVPQARIGLGHMAAKAGKHAEALDAFRAVADSPAPIKLRGEAAFNAALAANKLEQPAVADKYLRMVLTTPGMEDYRTDAQTALMAALFAKEDYAGVVQAYQSATLKAAGEKEAARLMLVARSQMRLGKSMEALGLFREVERLVKPESDMAFHASYYRLLCFFKVEGRHVPEQVDAFLKIYRKSRPDDARIHTALMMKAESLYSDKDAAGAAKVYSEINADRIADKNRPGLFYQRGRCLAEAGDPQGAVRSLTEFIDRYPEDKRVPPALAKRAQAYAASADIAKAIKDFDRLTGADMPADLVSFAWLESARVRRAEGNLPDMITRYKALLEKVGDLGPKLQAEANFWIGQGLTKSNVPKEAAPFLAEARKLRAETYSKHAGLLLILCHFTAQDAPALGEEIELAIKNDYAGDIPEQVLQWAGMQAFNADAFAEAARYFALVATPKEPRETPKEVWRYLAKARLETGDAQGAFDSVANVLEVEDNPAWKADALLDKGRALMALDRLKEARAAADEALGLHPQGRTNAGLRELSGDLKVMDNDLAGAAAEYIIVIQFHEEPDIKPRVLHRLIEVMGRKGDKEGAAKYRRQLEEEFPEWQPAKPKPAPVKTAPNP